MIAAGIDVGSNSVRMLIADVSHGKINETLYFGRKITRLGGNLTHTGVLSDESIEQTLDLFKDFKEKIDTHNVDKVLAVATSAMREASNSDILVEEANKIGIPLTIISEKDEAYYTYVGVSSIFDGGDCIIYDIGGGSTEIIFVKDNTVVHTRSIPLGVVKLADMFDFASQPTEETIAKCQNYIISNLQSIFSAGFFGIKTLIGTAGSVTSVAAIDLNMSQYDPNVINGYILDKDKLDRAQNLLTSLAAAERLRIAGVEQGKEDLLIPGILIIKGIMQLTNAKRSVVSDCGLREGLVISAAK